MVRLIVLTLIFVSCGVSWAQETEGKEISPANLENQAIKVVVEEVSAFEAIVLRMKGSYNETGTALGKLFTFVMSKSVTPMSSPFGQYFNAPGQVKEEELSWLVGIEVSGKVEVEPPFEMVKVGGGLMATTAVTGPYERTGEVYPKIYQWITKNGYIPMGPPMEYWHSDPAQTPPEKCESEIHIPISKPAQ